MVADPDQGTNQGPARARLAACSETIVRFNDGIKET
jgi:hypothetical protein